MHEITLLVQLVKMVEKEARAHAIASQIDSIVVQVGQLTDIVPKYLTEYYPNVTEGTLLEGSHLEVEYILGNGRCPHCEKVFRVVENKGICPLCQTTYWELLSGREFILKEIRMVEETTE